MLHLNRKIAQPRRRDGISIIEVLTSMAVATIGVFGIMVMIPFAVQQSQLGLNSDAANALGRNAIEDMQVQGFLTVDSNNNLERITGLTGAPSILHFDPIGFAPPAGLNVLTDQNLPNNLTIDWVTGTLPNSANPLTADQAIRLCRSDDDIQHESAEEVDGLDGLAPPLPIFNADGTRQSNGRDSWSMFLIPEKAAGLIGTGIPIHRLRTYTLVYRDRFPEAYVPFAPTNFGFQNVVNQIIFANPIPLSTEVGADNLGRDDWVMLVDRIADANVAVAPYDARVMFAKVTRISDDRTVVTVDGGPFNITATTQMIHLTNVVNVFERSIALED